MKKGLSVLLVLAALFGFYGGAANIQDVLAAKSYWEDKSEQTTADLNKLEDGLNQLKDNNEAYLDGLEAVKDGEEALVKGEEELAEGRATLAQGEADYAAAPGKLADARAQLAAGEKELADGEAKLAAGYKAYNKGQDDLAAGKIKVSDGEARLAQAKKDLENGEKTLAAGKQAVAEGEESIDGLTKLIAGTESILNGYEGNWKPGYDRLKDARDQLYKGSNGSKSDLKALAAFLDSGASKYDKAVEDVSGDDEKQTADDYKDFIESTNEMAEDLPKIQDRVKEVSAGASNLYKALAAAGSNYEFAGTVSNLKNNLKQFAAFIENTDDKSRFVGGIDSIAKAYDNFDSTVDTKYNQYMASEEGKNTQAALVNQNMDNGWSKFFATDQGKGAIAQAKAGIAQAKGVPESAIDDDTAKSYIKENNEQAKAGVKAAVTEEVNKGIKENVRKQVLDAYNDSSNEEAGKALTEGKNTLTAVMKQISDRMSEINESVNGDNSKIKNQLLPGLQNFNSQATAAKIDELTTGQDSIADGLRTIAQAVLSNDTLKNGVEDKMGKDAISLLRAYTANPNLANSKTADFARFEGQMDTNPGFDSVLKQAANLLKATKAEGQKTLAAGKQAVADGEKNLAAGYKAYEAGQKDLAAGKKTVADGEKKLAAAEDELNAGEKKLAAGRAKLADGRAQYAQGLADYEAAPAKLAEGREALAAGIKKLQDGRAELAAGKEKLAEYEDGEQQVRDGLATLMASDRYADLQTIMERRNGDDNFDDADNHLNIAEGLEAVGTGREYQADTGEVVTKELSGRILGSGLELGAAAVALLAALLSLLKKFKGAAVSAIAAAAVGVSGMIAGNNAGMEMSSIAGSNLGATPMVAAGILAAVAAVFSVVHFTAKKEDE